jgi:hypothetical protein
MPTCSIASFHHACGFAARSRIYQLRENTWRQLVMLFVAACLHAVTVCMDAS